MFDKSITQADLKPENRKDAQMIALFYEELEDEVNTLKAFRREIRRFMFWLKSQDSGIQLKDVNFAVVKAYRDMLSNIPDGAISKKVTKYYSDKSADGINPDWRPFKQKSLSPRSIRTAMHLLSSFGNWLVTQNHIPANPFATSRKKSKKGDARRKLEEEVDTSKHFSTDEMDLILSVINHFILDASSLDNVNQVYYWRRFKFIFTFMRRTALRREEMTTIEWRNIKSEVRDDGAEMHLIRGIGKGDKDFTLPLSYDAYEVLQDYQSDLLAKYGDASGSVLKGKVRNQSISTSVLHENFKEAMGMIAEYLDSNWNEIEVSLPFKLNKALFIAKVGKSSLHYMRHSAITEYGKSVKDMRQLQEIARHDSINTTTIYWHAEKSDLHKAVNQESGQ